MSKRFVLISAILIFFFISKTNQQFPHKVWVYWSDTQQNLPTIYKLCYQKLKFMAQQSKWELTYLNDANLSQYADEEQFAQIKQKTQGKFIQNLIDVLKMMIMIKHGGVYVDLSSILIQDFNWLEKESLSMNDHIINRYGQFPQVLFFYNSMFLNNNIQINQKGQKTLEFPSIQAWFMAARPNSALMKQWKEAYLDIFTNDFHYFERFRKQHNLYLRNLDRENHALVQTTMNYLSVYLAIQYVIQKKQQEFDKQLTIFSNQSQRKLAVNYYNIWMISAHKGPLAYLPKTGISNHYEFYINLISKNQTGLSEQLQIGENPRYFIKLTGQQTAKMNYLLQKSKKLQNLEYQINQFSYIFNLVNLTCKNHLFIQKDSPLQKYLLQGNQLALRNLNAHIYDQTQINDICGSTIDQWQNYVILIVSGIIFLYFLLKITKNYTKIIQNLNYNFQFKNEETIQMIQEEPQQQKD